jgi:hypothetical protein
MGKFSRRLGRRNGIPVIGAQPQDSQVNLQTARNETHVLIRFHVRGQWVVVGLDPDACELLTSDLARMTKEIREGAPIVNPEAPTVPAPAEEASLCPQCNARPVAYPGAVYCGAACSAEAEAHVPPKGA